MHFKWPAGRGRLCPLLALALLPTLRCAAADDYQLGPDSAPQTGVPRGALTKHLFTNSAVFPGTVHEYQVYVPHQYDPARAACLMVFQDGQTYSRSNGDFRATVVFDNLIHRKEMPVTIGVFVNPGEVRATE